MGRPTTDDLKRKVQRERSGVTWSGQVPDDHFWAFFHFCRRQGDELTVNHRDDGLADLTVKRKGVDW